MSRIRAIISALLALTTPLISQGVPNTWTPPQIVNDSGDTIYPTDPSSTVKLGVDGTGNGIALWLNVSTSTTQVVQAKRYNFNTNTWYDEQTLTPIAQSYDLQQIAVNSSGQAIAAWRNSSTSTGTIEACYFTGTTWLPLQSFSSTGNYNNPQVSIDAQGNAIVIFSEDNGSILAYNFPSNSPQNPVNISTNLPNSTTNVYPRLQIGMYGMNNAIAMTVVRDITGGFSVQAYLLNGTWSALTGFPPATIYGITSLGLAVNSSGAAAATWFVNNGTDNPVTAAYLKPNTTSFNYTGIGGSVNVLYLNEIRPPIAIAPNGLAVALTAATLQQPQYTIYNPVTMEWSPIANFSFSSNILLPLAVGLDNLGNGFGFFLASTDYSMSPSMATYSIQASRFMNNAFSNTLTQISSLSSPTTSLISGSFDVAANGNALGAWKILLDDVLQIQAAAYTAPPPPPPIPAAPKPPRNLNAVQKSDRYPTQTVYLNVLTWDKSLSKNIVSYRIYKEGIRIADVPKETLTFTDHNIDPAVIVTYEVKAVNAQKKESKSATAII